MENTQTLPSEEIKRSEYLILLTNIVHLGVIRVKNLLLVAPLTQLVEGLLGWLQLKVYLEDCPQHNWEKSENHVEKSDRPRKPKRLPRSHAVKTKGQLHHCEDSVFVEKVENHL